MTARAHGAPGALALFLCFLQFNAVLSENMISLVPPYFNLASGKKISATATCGDEGQEWYCKLVGANADHENVEFYKGQVCDFCDVNVEGKRHPPEYAVDEMETWWQSPPLSRGMKYNEVNLTIDLGQEFHVAYVFVRMGNSPRPGLWSLEKSADYGKSFTPWMYFSDSPQDCERYFGKESIQPITRDDSVICSTEYSQIVPLEGGEIPISLLNNRPSANKYFNSSVLQEWTRATNVRLRLIRTKNLLGHLMSVARQDPTVTRRYFYSIKDISIGGRCMCNGHAENCDPVDPESDSKFLVCRCQHNTCGPQCTQCCPGFEQKKWRISQNWNQFVCEPCNCHNHTTECEFDAQVDEQRLSLDVHGRYEGGGVCKNCQHNTEGINCNKCKPYFYRPSHKSWSDIDVCQPCQCDPHYSTGHCAEVTGQCECRAEFSPPHCDSCAHGYFDYPDCKACPCNLNGTEGANCTPTGGLCPCKYNYAGNSCEICADGYYSTECKNCECNTVGSVSTVCDKESGNCTCKSKYAGRTCNQCEAGYYNYPTCAHCNCDTSGTLPNICDDVTGQCICKDGFGGARCDQCISGFYMEVRGRERVCVPCNCSAKGATSTGCSSDGKCNCMSNFGGNQCDQCSPGYYQYPQCLPCHCEMSGSIGSTCDGAGKCHCKQNFDGDKCDRCEEHFYNYPICEGCNCDPRGVVASFAGCGSVPAGELCQCKDLVQGRICNDCKPLFWNLQEYNPMGCEECKCHLPGTLGGLGACNTKTGQCTCKRNAGERACDQCRDGFYKLENDNVFGCTECDCDVGGSINDNCLKETGLCRCHSRVEGRRCDQPIRAHYFPTLHQFQYEIEDGFTPSGEVRYRSSEEVFPDYSWKGYVVFSSQQNEVINVVHIAKPSLYRVVLKYVNPLQDAVVAGITVTPEYVQDVQQKSKVLLRPTSSPQLVTVAGDKGNMPLHLVMNNGNWTVTIKTIREVMIDYFVLIPEAYYEATILRKQVERPCQVGDRELCRLFHYPLLDGRPTATVNNLVTGITKYIDNPMQLNDLEVGSTDIPLLDAEQSELKFNLNVEQPGPYVIIVEYVSPVNASAKVLDDNMILPNSIVTARFQSGEGPESAATININQCLYRIPCRQILVDDSAKIFVADVKDANNVIYIDGESDTLMGIKSIIAIPESEWHLDYITPTPFCLLRDGKCTTGAFNAAVDSKKVEMESGEFLEKSIPPIVNSDSNATVEYVRLSPDADTATISSKVPSPGDYLFVVHYTRPVHPTNKIFVTLLNGDEEHEAEVAVRHCPSVAGCRALVTAFDANTRFPIKENFSITFENGDNKGDIWLDYVLVVKSSDYMDTVLQESNVIDYTNEFITKCATNHYYVSTNETGFCRDSIFSITADHNSGTLSCLCDKEGSRDFECEPFGGQCKCRPNVIGRKCSVCRTGYYGFPNCKPCDCPSTAICDDNGECICPKNVEGENCDTCKPYTFNFDVQRGCDACGCHPLGVRDGLLQCDARNGSCSCKENVIGRVCDRCVPGHYAFPECRPCACERDGTADDVCDQSTAQCYCKRHTTGPACDSCREEYFNLQADNVGGCTKCYCFGKTTRCSSAGLFWAEINGMDDWVLVNIETKPALAIVPFNQPPNKLNESVIGADLVTGDTALNVVYFGAPRHYLGKRLTSYGGYLRYSIFYTARDGGNAIAAADVIIQGANNNFIFHNSVEQPPALENWLHSVRLSEDEFSNLDGSSVTREQFMNTIANVTAIYVRATYWHEAVTTRLTDVSLDVAIEDYAEQFEPAFSVEHCQCPSQYKGLSCEQCAEGHYRLASGFCVPCQCNGHSDTCDVNTGVCLNCQHDTIGDHCDQCIEGYHGDATVGTNSDCQICACPMPYTSNNFAIGCELSDNGTLIACACKPGYGGPRCEYCAAGYYGVPEEIGDYCKPCNCSGNINVEDPGSCDSITGDCLKCVNNTAGAACNLCAPGFFGDAIFSKNCTACVCDEYGMDHCDPSTGTCVCRAGVEGGRCDRCAAHHWGLASGAGCTPCDCALAAESPQCDDNTGQCKCAKGVTGLHCDQCAAGYWNYSKEGCVHCNCNSGYSVGFMCNATGQCECLPGVVGEKCDRCPERWVLLPHEGCLECDSCTDALIFSVEDLRDLLANETQDFKDKADSFFTTQRLNYIANQTQELRPRLGLLQSVDVENVSSAVVQLEGQVKTLLRSAEFAATDSERQIQRAAELNTAADSLLLDVRDSSQKADDVVKHVADLATGLELSQQPKVDSALIEANQIKNDLADDSLQPKKELAMSALTNSTEQLEGMNLFVEPVNNQSKKFEALVVKHKELKNKLNDMTKYTDQAQLTATAAAKLNANNRASKFGTKVNSVSEQNSVAMENLVDAAYSISNASTISLVAKSVLNNSAGALANITTARALLGERLVSLTAAMPELLQLRDTAAQHGSSLSSRAEDLRQLAEQENNNTRTQHAYSAASAYKSIVQEIADGKQAAGEAAVTVRNATDINNDLKERVGPALERSQRSSAAAGVALRTARQELAPNLTRAHRSVADAQATLAYADDEDNAIRLSLPTAPRYGLGAQTAEADRVALGVADTLATMSELGGGLTASKDWAQSLPKVADETMKMTFSVKTLLNNLQELGPQITSAHETVKSKQEDLENQRRQADEQISKLKDLIEQARTVANRIQVGVTFDSTSTLQPRLPDAVDEMSTTTRVSAYFRTKEKNGLILYLGNPKGTTLRRTKSDDFIVLDIQNGYPYLMIDIGDSAFSGRAPVRIGSDKFVADNKWYQVIVDRVGRNVKLSIRESLDNGTDVVHAKEAVLPGQHTIFNLDREKSKLYVGGVPSEALHKLQGISYPAFDGQVEELMIGDTPVGLWNFADAANLKGARQREKLLTSQSGPQEYRFNGRGRVRLSGRKYAESDRNHLSLQFRTYAPDGLVYFVGDEKHFFSVQIQDGRVYLKVSLGDPSDMLVLGTTKTYNDGKWHKLDAARVLRECSLRVDSEPQTRVESASSNHHIPADVMSFGGSGGRTPDVMATGFDGCLRQISIYSLNIDLSDNLEWIGVAYGCQFSSLVSLSGDESFLRFVNVTVENLQLTLKFKTAAPDGLLFVYSSRTQTADMQDSISLALVSGKLVLTSQRERLDTGLAAYNDSQWHVVTVTHSDQALRLVVDDFDYFSTDAAPAPLHILDGVLFVGGVQPGYVLGGGPRRPFAGCIADASLNGRALSLLGPYANRSVTFGRCGSTISTGGLSPDQSVWPSPTRADALPTATPPVAPTEIFATPPPEITTVKAPAREGAAPPPGEAPRAARPPPLPERGCQLAYDPYYTVGDAEEGYLFGTRNDSRIEYGRLPGRQHDGFDLSVTFRTFDDHGGLMFYAAAEKSPQQFLALYMKKGKLTLAFNCGQETVSIRSQQTYKEANWHTVTVVRNGPHGKLSVDKELVGEAVGRCQAPAALAPPYHYGGLKHLSEDVKKNLDNFYQPFKGCLKGLLMNGQKVTDIITRVNAVQCKDNVEGGIYFGPSTPGHNSYLRLKENFSVGREISISLEIKARNSTGLLLAVHGSKDFMIVELLEDELVANVENGKGPFHASFKLGNKFTLCDGKWHKIQAVKSSIAVSVGIDNHYTGPGLGQKGSGTTNTKSALFIGGHPKSKIRGAKSHRGFTGCMRNIVINETPMPVPLGAAHGNIQIGACPAD